MSSDNIKKVTVIGAGTMGIPIAFTVADKGFDVILHDSDPVKLEAADAGFVRFFEERASADKSASKDLEAVLQRITLTDKLESACRECDLVIETIFENFELKQSFYGALNEVCPAKTIFVTNSSSFLPSMFAEATKRGNQFLALHFHTLLYPTIVDVMPHPGTDEKVTEEIFEFAKQIGQIPVLLKKENVGYIFNALLTALNQAAMDLVLDGVATPEEVDRCWMGVMRQPIGPFGQLDRIGIGTASAIASFWSENLQDDKMKRRAKFLRDMVDSGRTGVMAGKGFYTYPDAEYRKKDFVTGK